MNLSAGRMTRRLPIDDGRDRAEALGGEHPSALRGLRRRARRSGSSAISGITARSWNSRIANVLRPAGEESCSRSPSHASTIAVDDIARPKPTTIAGCHARPNACAITDEHDAARQHLRAAEAEHGVPQRPQPRGLELQPDQEEEQHDAELGRVLRALGLRDEAQAPGADQDARGDVAQHAAELQSPEERHDDHGRRAGRWR